MKKLLIIFLFAFGTAAFANDNDKQKDNIANPGTEENKSKNSESKKDSARLILKGEEEKAKPETVKTTKRLNCNSADGSRFGISVYFAEMVSNNNLKLIKKLLTD